MAAAGVAALLVVSLLLRCEGVRAQQGSGAEPAAEPAAELATPSSVVVTTDGVAGHRCPGMTDTEYITEATLWTIVASPLIVATGEPKFTLG